MSKDKLIIELEKAKSGFSKVLEGIKELKSVDQELIRGMFKHNERLSHCESASFIVRSEIDERPDEQLLQDIVEETEYLITEYKNFIGVE